jgi:enoyl-CoA hydratase/carnithine racemase
MNIVSHGPTDGVFEIEIDRPEKKNALTETMYRDLTSALVTAEQDPQTRVVLIYGQPFCFTAGNDLQDFFDNPPTSDNAPVFVFLRAMASLTKPIVCAINGAAVGIGTTLCCHADLVYCGDTVKFQLPFARLGLVPEFASSYLIPRLAGHVKAFELLVLGEPFGAQTALDIGMINAFFDDEAYLTAAKQKAKQLAALPEEAVRATKKLIKDNIKKNVDTSMSVESRVFSERLQSPEAKEKLSQFLNR